MTLGALEEIIVRNIRAADAATDNDDCHAYVAVANVALAYYAALGR